MACKSSCQNQHEQPLAEAYPPIQARCNAHQKDGQHTDGVDGYAEWNVSVPIVGPLGIVIESPQKYHRRERPFSAAHTAGTRPKCKSRG